MDKNQESLNKPMDQEVLELFGSLDPFNVHIKRFLLKESKLKKNVTFQRKNLLLTTNLFVGFTCLLCIRFYGIKYLPSFLFGFTCHSLNKYFAVNGGVLTSCYWRTSLAFLDMRLRIIRDRIQRESDIQQILLELNHFQRQVIKFDKCLQGFLFSAFVSFTPIFITLVHSALFGNFNAGGGLLLPLLLFIMTPVYMLESVIPMFEVAKLWATSRSLTNLLHQKFSQNKKTLSIHQQMKLIKWIKVVSDDDHPLSPVSFTSQVLTPNWFFHYLLDLIVNLLMVIDFFRK